VVMRLCDLTPKLSGRARAVALGDHRNRRRQFIHGRSAPTIVRSLRTAGDPGQDEQCNHQQDDQRSSRYHWKKLWRGTAKGTNNWTSRNCSQHPGTSHDYGTPNTAAAAERLNGATTVIHHCHLHQLRSNAKVERRGTASSHLSFLVSDQTLYSRRVRSNAC
jgi:hypothetical protein